MKSESPTSLRQQLLAVAELWAERNDRSLGALASVAVNHGGSLERLRDPSNGVTDLKLEKFATFLANPENWPDGDVPEDAIAFAHRVGVTPPSPTPSNGKVSEISADQEIAA